VYVGLYTKSSSYRGAKGFRSSAVEGREHHVGFVQNVGLERQLQRVPLARVDRPTIPTVAERGIGAPRREGV